MANDDQRRKNRNWLVANVGEAPPSVEYIQLAVLMDIRDELQAINAKMGCYRIPRALDALAEMGAEMGADLRRKKRAAAKKRKAAKQIR